MNTKQLLLCGLISGMALAVASCDKDNNNTPPAGKGSFVLSVTGESAEYLMQVDDPGSGEVSIGNNNQQLEQSGYTWIFNSNPSVAVGLIYQQGDPGIGLGYRLSPDATLEAIGAGFQIPSRFTSYGFFGDYAITSVGGQTPAGTTATDGVTFNFIDLKKLSLETKPVVRTQNIAGNGEQATFSGIVDMGNGEFLTGMVLSQPRDPNATGGASSGIVTYPDSVWVAAYDASLNLKRIYRDGRISYSSGRFRSQYYAQIGKADDGNVYVFSGSFESTTKHPCGALRIPNGGTAFDDYYFDIEALTEELHFRKVWHITGNYFLLEFYNDKEPSALGAATKYGVVNMSAKSFKWVTGIPAYDQITGTGLPMAYGGQLYFPITAADPAIYVIDPASASATKGMTVTGATNINAVGRLTNG
ncbi:MAG: DUF4374 domain-containing protein [Prevotellaceae bacterium]|jgi:hypothetical protein|nr:DUF4374 domain-containing protein [Prevotellaceae bacterium]